MSERTKERPTEYPIGDVPSLTLAPVLAVAQAGFRTAADLHRARRSREGERTAWPTAARPSAAMHAILIGVFRGDVDQAAKVTAAVRAETHRRLADSTKGARR